MKKVSIIVPIYNGEDYIVRCVNSLTNQTYKNTEIILVDDGSTDNSLDLCKKIASSDKRIFVYHKPNGGLSSARNFGLEKSTGDYIGFVDCDDYVDSKMYEDLIKLIIDKPSTDIACCNFVRVFENDKKDYSHCIFSSKHIQTSQGYFESLLLHKGDVSVCTKLFNRELLRGRRFDETKLNEDLLFIFSLNITNVYFTGNESYFYAFRTNSLSTSFGKAVLDMGPNSIFISNEIVSNLRAGTRTQLDHGPQHLLPGGLPGEHLRRRHPAHGLRSGAGHPAQEHPPAHVRRSQ